MEAESQDSRSECRRCREHGYIERGVDQEGHEAEESPDALRAVRARGEASLVVQGVQRLSARSSAHSVQGVRWGINLRARSSALSVQGVRWGINMRARSSALSVQGVRWASICEHGRQRLMQGVRWVTNMRARSSSASVQGVRWVRNMRARSSSALRARSAVGGSICEHGRQRSQCKECGGQESASTVVSALMQGVRWVTNMRARSSALYVQGVRWVTNLRARSAAL